MNQALTYILSEAATSLSSAYNDIQNLWLTYITVERD